MNAIAMMNVEIAARRDVRLRLEQAQERAGEAAAKARLALQLTVRMAATAVNEELDHVPDAQAVARACILKDDIDATCVSIEQYLNDLLFQPLQLLMRQADDR
jgi:hypothetical protein